MTPALAHLVALVDEEIRAQAAAPTREDGVDLALDIRHAIVSGRDLDAREGARMQLLLRDAAWQDAERLSLAGEQLVAAAASLAAATRRFTRQTP